MARLILTTEDDTQGVELLRMNTLGRHPDNSIQLLDRIVSKYHCVVERRDGRWILRDLDSLNHTYVNGAIVDGEVQLHHGDEIRIGACRACFDDRSPPPPAIGPSVSTVVMPPSTLVMSPAERARAQEGSRGHRR